MKAQPLNTVDQFYGALSQGRLVCARCRSCGHLLLPPRPACPKCRGDEFESLTLTGRGEIKSYTIIHVPPANLKLKPPYAVGIVKLKEGPSMPGILRIPHERVKVGCEVEIAFERGKSRAWPRWPRYYFKLAK